MVIYVLLLDQFYEKCLEIIFWREVVYIYIYIWNVCMYIWVSSSGHSTACLTYALGYKTCVLGFIWAKLNSWSFLPTPASPWPPHLSSCQLLSPAAWAKNLGEYPWFLSFSHCLYLQNVPRIWPLLITSTAVIWATLNSCLNLRTRPSFWYASRPGAGFERYKLEKTKSLRLAIWENLSFFLRRKGREEKRQ